MIHDERAHDMLAPDDMMDHLIKYHDVLDPGDIDTRVDVETWLTIRGIESTGDRDIDLQVRYHTLDHERDETIDELVIEIGRLVGGLAAPMSIAIEMGPATVGKWYGVGGGAWRRVRELLHCQGWERPEEISERINRLLEREEPS